MAESPGFRALHPKDPASPVGESRRVRLGRIKKLMLPGLIQSRTHSHSAHFKQVTASNPKAQNLCGVEVQRFSITSCNLPYTPISGLQERGFYDGLD